MNYLIKGFLAGFLIVISYSSYAQQMMQTKKDIHIICQNDHQFVGKPLYVLLEEIKPSIKMVFAEGGWREKTPHISFFFITRDEYQNCLNNGKSPIKISVFLKDIFEWSMEKRTRTHFWEWRKEDKENLGNNIVTYLRVSGDCDQGEMDLITLH